MNERYDFFLGGVIQGSVAYRTIMPQNYRAAIREIIARRTPGRMVYDPVEHHAQSVEYSDGEAREVFFDHVTLARYCDFFIAYLPTASMGTAIEMWECFMSGSPPVITISPMAHNWVIRILSGVVLKDLSEFESWLSEENLKELVRESEKKFGE